MDLSGLAYPNTTLFAVLIVIAVIWSSIWKGIALWRAGGNRHLVWFIVLFIFNTLGILEIIYIFGFSHRKQSAATS
jgi:methionyl-tRNA synthetase